MSNALNYLPETDGSNISKALRRVGAVMQNADGSDVTTAVPLPVIPTGLLVNVNYDYISMSYTGSNVTGIVYKLGGPSGTVVATLTLGYSGANLTTITRT